VETLEATRLIGTRGVGEKSMCGCGGKACGWIILLLRLSLLKLSTL